jgi:hypothetical protein
MSGAGGGSMSGTSFLGFGLGVMGYIRTTPTVANSKTIRPAINHRWASEERIWPERR